MRRSLLVAVLVVAAACSKKKNTEPTVQTAPVARQNIVVDVEATGVVTPINAVEVRSKASGQITAMPVQTGEIVKPGQLLVKIDPRDAQSRYNQAAAAVHAAQANLEISRAQYARQDTLFKAGVITAPELESARITEANAESQLAAAKTSLEQAEIALEDVTIRAPVAGTVISKNVSLGQVIASATNSPSGGTVLLTMANLGTVYDSTLVSESDIGNVKPGQQATVRVDAYPNRVFRGVVEKIEPQATVQQSVTMFPVLVRLDNQDGALMPGMNSDVTVLVAQEDNVLAIPNDAIRSPREASTAAQALGLDPQKVRSELQSQFAGAGGAGGNGARRGATRGGQTTSAGGDLANAPVSVSQAQCDSIQATLAKHPEVQQRLQALRGQMMNGGDAQTLRTQMAAVYDSAHIDPRVARACMQLRRNSAGGTQLAMGAPGESPAGNAATHPGLVFVAQNGTFAAKMVQLGVSNYDVTQVVSGLNEGEQVALISAAMLQQARSEFQQRVQSRMGLPGVNQQQQGGARSGTSGSSGSRRGGP